MHVTWKQFCKVQSFLRKLPLPVIAEDGSLTFIKPKRPSVLHLEFDYYTEHVLPLLDRRFGRELTHDEA